MIPRFTPTCIKVITSRSRRGFILEEPFYLICIPKRYLAQRRTDLSTRKSRLKLMRQLILLPERSFCDSTRLTSSDLRPLLFTYGKSPQDWVYTNDDSYCLLFSSQMSRFVTFCLSPYLKSENSVFFGWMTKILYRVIDTPRVVSPIDE